MLFFQVASDRKSYFDQIATDAAIARQGSGLPGPVGFTKSSMMVSAFSPDVIQRVCGCAAQRGIRVIIDLVVKHKSKEHKWFQEARRDPTVELDRTYCPYAQGGA
jgi:hypothetical protein